VLLSGCALSIQFSKNSTAMTPRAPSDQMTETQRSVEKWCFSAIFLVSGLALGKKYLDHKDFSLNVKKNRVLSFLL
jgi:hypothetical protein